MHILKYIWVFFFQTEKLICEESRESGERRGKAKAPAKRELGGRVALEKREERHWKVIRY